MRHLRAAARKADLGLIALAVALVITQVLLATLSGRGDSWGDRYRSLCIWDGGWYSSIVEHGYTLESPPDTNGQTNLAFFPGYPIAARLVYRMFHTSAALALLVTSQASACAFWAVLLHALRRWQVSSSVTLAAIALIFCHPAGFFMVVTYSESLFFAALLVFLFEGSRARASTGALVTAAAAGYVASATRIVGAPLAAIPLLWALRDIRTMPKPFGFSRIAKTIWPYAIVSVATAAGTLSHFAYCAYRFGHWDMYLRAKAAWGVGNFAVMDLLQPELYRPLIPHFLEDHLLAQDISHLYVPVLLLSLVVLPVIDWLFSRGPRLDGFWVRAPFYIAAWLFFLALAGGSGLAKVSFFLRYGLYCHILLVLALAHGFSQTSYRNKELSLPAQVIVFLCCGAALGLQLTFCSRFSHAGFVG